jgi:hypothetical protein
MKFLGFTPLNTNLPAEFLIRDNNNVPQDPAVLPTFRIYGPSGLMTNGTGTLAQQNTGTLTNATNASPIVVTSTGHGLTGKPRVTISGVVGNTAANGTFTITVIDANTFSLDGSTGNGAYTSGGTWHVTGLYSATLDAQASDGYASGTTYFVYTSWTVGGSTYGDLDSYTVV